MVGMQEFRSLPKDERRRVVTRFLLFQIPDGIVLLLILGLLRMWVDLPAWLFWTIVGAWVFKNIAWFPFGWRAYRPSERGHRMIGEQGFVEHPLTPVGYVRIKGELWQAREAREGRRVEAGMEVRVSGVEGLTLIVEPLAHARDAKESAETRVDRGQQQ